MKKQATDVLFTPFEIGKVRIKNRIVETAMTGTSLFFKGQFNEPVREFYLTRARGGVGMIVTGAAMVKDIFGRDYDLDQCAAVFEGPVKALVDEVHSYDCRMFLQIGVGLGRVVGLKPFEFLEGADLNKVRTASSRLPNVWNSSIIHEEMAEEEIEQRIRISVAAAEMAKNAGFDGVEIHAVHEGYLLDQFAIKNTNHRTDQYGGNLENRLRFATTIIRKIKKRCGKDFPVSVRYSVVSKMKGLNSAALPGEEYQEFGRDYDESVEVARMLQDAGCDCLDADNGSYDSWYWAHPPVYMEKSCNLKDCAFIKRYVDIPVICAGRMDDPYTSAEAIEEGSIDGIGIARQLLADPMWPEKLREGVMDDIMPCIACHTGCLGRLLDGGGLSCALNPAVLREEEYRIIPAKQKQNILVVGGGIGGMAAARVCALRGHRVSLYEKTDQLGGVFIAAAAPFFKEDDRRLIEWYKRQMQKLNIKVHLNTEITANQINELMADHIIIATGAKPKPLPIKGIDQRHVMSVTDYLLETKTTGNNVIVIGGGLSGCEAAYDLACKGRNVTVIEMTDQILNTKGLSAANATMLKDLLDYHHVTIITEAAVKEITENAVVIKKNGCNSENDRDMCAIPADSVIIATGYNADPLKLPGTDMKHVHIIGDAVKAGNLMTAIHDAWNVAMNI